MSVFKRFLVILAASVMLFAVGCSEIEDEEIEVTETTVTEPEPQPYPAYAGQLEFDEAPKTAASLSPAITEIICGLGYGDKLVGISDYCDRPEEITGRQTLGSAANPNIDEIIGLRPELLISQSPIAKKDVVRLEGNGIGVMILPAPDSVSELRDCYRDISAVFGGELTADAAADDAMKDFYAEMNSAEGTVDSFLFILTPDLNAASTDTFMGDMLSCLGRNTAQSPNLTAEDILADPPELLILASPMAVTDLPEELQALDCITENRVMYLKPALLERPAARVGGYISDIAKAAGDILSGETVSETEEASEETDEASEGENE